MEDNFNEYMLSQVHAIDEAKWLEGCKIGRDPGDNFILDWISKNAEGFRTNWKQTPRGLQNG